MRDGNLCVFGEDVMVYLSFPDAAHCWCIQPNGFQDKYAHHDMLVARWLYHDILSVFQKSLVCLYLCISGFCLLYRIFCGCGGECTEGARSAVE